MRSESDGILRTLTCQTRSDGSHPIIRFYHCAKCIIGTNITKIVSDRSGSGNEKSDGI